MDRTKETLFEHLYTGVKWKKYWLLKMDSEPGERPTVQRCAQREYEYWRARVEAVYSVIESAGLAHEYDKWRAEKEGADQ